MINLFNKNNYKPIKKYNNLKENKSLIISDNKNKIGIYCLTNINNGKKYVGMSKTDLGRRLSNYFQNSYLSKKSGLILPALKNNHSSFYIEILEYCNKNIVKEREYYFINSIQSEYNIKGKK
jgi:group I intron endonuclease